MAAPQTEAKLLVVEDDPNILELLSASLRFAGFDVSTATSGSAAVSAAKDRRPDLVVLDVMLPDLDGFEVIRLMREGGARTPVVFLTARDGTDDKIRGPDAGRRRLRHQAVQPRGADRADPRGAAAHRRRRRDRRPG